MSEVRRGAIRRASQSQVIAAAIVGIALLLPMLKCALASRIEDPDVWWHVRAGEWIVEHRALPTVDTFSSYGLGKPWTAYSWIPELILHGLYETLGLRGLLAFTAVCSAAVLAAFYGLIRRLRPPGSLDVILLLAATLGLLPVLTPRPWLLSILFFVVELDLLLTAGRSGNRRLLLWLVPLFVLWANAHIQFVLGLVVLGAAVAEPVVASACPGGLVDEDSRRISFRWMLLIFVLCVGATLITPYHVHLYGVAAQLLGQSRLWGVIQELLAMPFRSPSNWVTLAATVGAAFALGWRRRGRLLLVLLLALGLCLGFRSQRDAWLALLMGLTTVAYCCPRREETRRPKADRLVKWAVPAAVAAGVAALCLSLSEDRLRKRTGDKFPAQAVEFIAGRAHGGPLFNHFDWGGYLILHLPEIPVSIDGRTMVHGEQRVLRNVRTLRGDAGWEDDPELAEARLVVLPRRAALTAILRLDGRFQLVHEDPVAVVFSRAEPPVHAGRPIHCQIVQTCNPAE